MRLFGVQPFHFSKEIWLKVDTGFVVQVLKINLWLYCSQIREIAPPFDIYGRAQKATVLHYSRLERLFKRQIF